MKEERWRQKDKKTRGKTERQGSRLPSQQKKKTISVPNQERNPQLDSTRAKEEERRGSTEQEKEKRGGGIGQLKRELGLSVREGWKRGKVVNTKETRVRASKKERKRVKIKGRNIQKNKVTSFTRSKTEVLKPGRETRIAKSQAPTTEETKEGH